MPERDSAPSPAQMDPALMDILLVLWNSADRAPGKPCSLARLSKQCAVQMSTLLRHMNSLLGAGLAEMTLREEGGGEARLSAAGCDLCRSIFTPASSDQPAGAP